MPFDYIIVFLLSFFTVVFIIMKAMHEGQRNTGSNGRRGDDGGDWGFEDLPPVIDLPPGVSWPTDEDIRKPLDKTLT